MSRPQGLSAGRAQLRLAPDPSAARDARAWVTAVLARWPDESVETARLLLSELVTNSVLHAGTAIAVTYRPERRRARFEVSDGCRREPTVTRDGPYSATGRGMRLVASLSDDWGVQREPAGKTIWFVVSPTSTAWRAGSPRSRRVRGPGTSGDGSPVGVPTG